MRGRYPLLRERMQSLRVKAKVVRTMRIPNCAKNVNIVLAFIKWGNAAEEETAPMNMSKSHHKMRQQVEDPHPIVLEAQAKAIEAGAIPLLAVTVPEAHLPAKKRRFADFT